MGVGAVDGSPESLPFLPVPLFKTIDLRSVPDSQVTRVLTSSGTSGRPVSRIALDSATSVLLGQAFVAVTRDLLGATRRPMMILDSRDVLHGAARGTARAAAVLGFAPFGRDHFYALDADLRPNWDAVRAWLDRQGTQPILLFGFTFIVWQCFVQAAREQGISLTLPKGSLLLHGGGWKRMADQAVSPQDFADTLAQTFALQDVRNYYGMVEQTGAVFMSCPHGRLHVPCYADVLVRDPASLRPLPQGESGLLQVMSILPRSYPGHVLLSEDLGAVTGEDDCPCGRPGKTVRIEGRLPAAELRGCSETRVVGG